jgi:hypothetical protein
LIGIDSQLDSRNRAEGSSPMIAHRNSATRHRFPLAFAICAAAVSLPTMAA